MPTGSVCRTTTAVGAAKSFADAPGGVEVEEIVERRLASLKAGRIRHRAVAVGGLPVQGGPLVGVLAVRQVHDLLEDHADVGRERRSRDLVEVRGDLRVVGGHDGERLRGEALAKLGRDAAPVADLGDHLAVGVRVRDRRHAGVVAAGRRQEGRATDVDHPDRLVERHAPLADLRGEGLHVDHDDVDKLDPVLGQLGELVGAVAAGEDPGVDRRVEGLDHSPEQRRDVGQGAHRLDVHSVGREVLTGPVRRVDLDVECQELAREVRQPLAVRDREEGSHPAGPPYGRAGISRAPTRAARACGGDIVSRAEYSARPWHTRAAVPGSLPGSRGSGDPGPSRRTAAGPQPCPEEAPRP